MGLFKKTALQEIKTESSEEEKKHTILIVDDEEDNLFMLSDLLSEKYEVLTARNGMEALDLIQNEDDPERIHLIISDQRMPQMTGVELLEKTIATIPRAYRMILTGFIDVGAIINSINKGQIYKFLLKPFEPNDMTLTVQRALKAYELETENHLLLEELKDLNKNLEGKVEERTADLKREVELRRERQAEMDRELNQAKETQKSLLPSALPKIPGSKTGCKYVPLEQIGGDFYNLFELDEENFGIMIADVTGHGVPVALISFMISGIFMNNIRSNPSTSKAMMLTNSMLQERMQEGKFSTMFYGIYNSKDQTLTYTNGGHPPAIVIRPETKEIIHLDTMGTVLGPFSNEVARYEEKKIQLQPKDRLLLYTDGITEVIDQNNQVLGADNLDKMLVEHCDLPIQELLEQLYAQSLKYTGGDGFKDDFTLLGLEVGS